VAEAFDEESTVSAPGPARPDSRGEDDRPRRGRRRGRRGRRSRSDDPAAEQIDTDDTEVEPGGEDAAPTGADAGEEPEETALEEDLAERPAQPAAEDDDDEPVETFADWN